MSRRVTWVYFVTRDRVDGKPSARVKIWAVRPRRVSLGGGLVRWIAPAEGAEGRQWDGDVPGCLRWCGVVPDDDLMMLRVERWAKPAVAAAV